ncbi:MAG: hypothetical protein A2Z02_05050 [Chloroflexi bacterium RBG_16_48_7]|nr:MAG: hypothetical protein A2Z02_05050 [Chloroflexi bacterium RBG_16_48_7]
MHLNIFSDGASRGNPGHSSIGIVINNDLNQKVAEVSRYIGVGTNNQAEYTAVLTALKEAQKLKAASVTLYIDSELIARQLTGEYKVKNKPLQLFFTEVIKIMRTFRSFNVVHIERSRNSEADKLANKALDSFLKNKSV